MRTTLTLAVLLLFGASATYADRWVSSKTLPKPVDYPIVRKDVKEHHKAGKKANHPPLPVG